MPNSLAKSTAKEEQAETAKGGKELKQPEGKYPEGRPGRREDYDPKSDRAGRSADFIQAGTDPSKRVADCDA